MQWHLSLLLAGLVALTAPAVPSAQLPLVAASAATTTSCTLLLGAAAATTRLTILLQRRLLLVLDGIKGLVQHLDQLHVNTYTQSVFCPADSEGREQHRLLVSVRVLVSDSAVVEARNAGGNTGRCTTQFACSCVLSPTQNLTCMHAGSPKAMAPLSSHLGCEQSLLVCMQHNLLGRHPKHVRLLPGVRLLDACPVV